MCVKIETIEYGIINEIHKDTNTIFVKRWDGDLGRDFPIENVKII